MADPGTFAAVGVTLYAAHQVADHVFGQTDWQAAAKADRTFAGWRALAGHVLQYHVVMLAMLLAAVLVLDLRVTLPGVAAGLGFSALSHGFLDRRWPVRRLLDLTGSPIFARMTERGMNGAYLADQALHVACLWVSALMVVSIG